MYRRTNYTLFPAFVAAAVAATIHSFSMIYNFRRYRLIREAFKGIQKDEIPWAMNQLGSRFHKASLFSLVDNFLELIYFQVNCSVSCDSSPSLPTLCH